MGHGMKLTEVIQGTKKKDYLLLTLQGTDIDLRETKLGFAKGRGSVYNIGALADNFGVAADKSDPLKMWMCLGPLEIAGDYTQYDQKDTIGVLSFLFSGVGSRDERILQTVDRMIADAFLEQFADKRCGEVFMTKDTFTSLFKPTLRTGQLSVKMAPDAVDVFDVEGNLDKKLRIDAMHLVGQKVNIVVEPKFIFVTKDMAVVHWRLRQLRFLSPVQISDADHDSDWSL